MGKNNTSSHILGASSNLLGICFVVLTALKIQNLREISLIDEITLIDIILFMLSCIFSFISLKMSNSAKSQYLEGVADSIFLIGLIVMFCMTIVAAVNLV